MVEEDVMPSLGETANGVRSGLHWAYGLDNPENNKFKDDYKKKSGKDANVFAVAGFDTARLIVEALNALKGDVSNVDKVIDAMSGVTFKGPRGTFALDKNSQAPKQRIYLRQVKKGADGNYHNAVLEDLGEIVDPGDNSKG
jgi:branched-chain amino acid transport system substrate-binding protein